jgi:hypothetical protein
MLSIIQSFYQYLTICLLLLLFTEFSSLIAQDKNPWAETPELEVSGFVDLFYAYDFNQPTTPYRQVFFFHHNRHNEFNLNLGLLKMTVNQTKYRVSFALQAGTYPNDNYAAEPGTLKNVFEAFAGISLNRKNNLWIDAGIFPSHLGFESAISMDNWTLTRSLVAENSPYFLAGTFVNWTPSDIIEIGGGIFNGWQRITRVPGNTMPSFGFKLVISPSENYSINWRTFIGTDDPDSTRRMMYFSNFYAQMQFIEQFGLIANLDLGFRQQSKGSSDYNDWYGITLIARYDFTEKWGAALRGELYMDPDGEMVTIEDSPNGFRTSGVSLNLDFIPIPQVACRIEGRWLHSPDNIYVKGETMSHDDFFIVASIAVKMGKKIL